MTLLSTIISIALLIPAVPAFAYIIGFHLPSTHIINRTVVLPTSRKRLWAILTDIAHYPQWQRSLEKIDFMEEQQKSTVDSDSIRTVSFIEYSTTSTRRRPRKTKIIQHERVPHLYLLRIFEETAIVNRPIRQGKPTFSGSWTFELLKEEELKEGQYQVTLKITEQGVIVKPMTRFFHLLLGYHTRMDKFLDELSIFIDHDQQQQQQQCQPIEKAVESCTLLGSADCMDDGQEGSELMKSMFESNDTDDTVDNDTANTPNDDRLCHDKANGLLTEVAVEKVTYLRSDSQGSAEWDLVNEAYERPPRCVQ